MKFVHTPEFRALNGGFALDEGCADTEDRFPYFYAERVNRTVRFRCHGSTGHGSYFHANANGPKVRYIIDKLMSFQESERLRLKDNSNLDIGEVTTVNLTMLEGGTQQNVLPTTVTLVFDIRVAMDVNIIEFENRVIILLPFNFIINLKNVEPLMGFEPASLVEFEPTTGIVLHLFNKLVLEKKIIIFVSFDIYSSSGGLKKLEITLRLNSLKINRKLKELQSMIQIHIG